MKQSSDASTAELPGLPKKRGRPSTGKAMSAAARKAKQRATKDLAVLAVELPVELLAQFNEYLAFKDKTKNEVIASLLQNQLLRKR